MCCELGVLILDKIDWLKPENGPGESNKSKWIGNGTGFGDGAYTGTRYLNIGYGDGCFDGRGVGIGHG